MSQTGFGYAVTQMLMLAWREGGDIEARTKTEQAIGKGKNTYFGIITVLSCFKVLLELLWELGSFYSQSR